MKILLINRENMLSKFGGDSIKTLKTKEYLEKNGIKVDLMLGDKKEINFNEYDLIHIFNLQNIKLTPLIIKKAQKANKPIILSTIFWRSKNTTGHIYEIYKKYNLRYSLPINISERMIGKKLSFKIFDYFYKAKFFYKERYAIKNIDWLIAESNSEINQMASYFNFPNLFKKSRAVPGGLNEEFFDQQIIKESLTKKIPPDFVLTVGRIDPIKNQLNIIKALFNEKRIPLVFIGSKKGYLSYKNYIKDFEYLLQKRGNVYWFDNMPQSQLKEFYQKAKVYAQPSIWETFGMAIFEAATFSCNLSITSEGGAKDYFQDKVLYCQPNNLTSIKESILAAWRKDRNPELANYIKENFTWDKVIKRIIEVYKRLVPVSSSSELV